MAFVRVLYVLGIAVLLVLLVILGVEAFYPGPSYPDYPDWAGGPPFGTPEYEEWWQERQREWDRVDEEYRQELSLYHRNVFLVVLPLGALVAVGGTFFRRRLSIFGAGLVLGGMGTMIYAIVPSELDSLLRFVGIAVALAVLVFVGFRVFNSRTQE
ncbi:MAG: hypothetical protein ACNA7X_01520 [Dehalococcoidia bacterium]